jgi:hypothetical protein
VDLCDAEFPAKRREVPTEEAETWAKEQGVLFVEASAKSGQNVEAAFVQAVSDILSKIRRGVFDDDRVRNNAPISTFDADNVFPCSSHLGSNYQSRPPISH